MTTVRIAEVRDATRRFWICTVTGSDPDGTDFTGGPEFDGSRWNDLHYTIAAKQAARAHFRRRQGALSEVTT